MSALDAAGLQIFLLSPSEDAPAPGQMGMAGRPWVAAGQRWGRKDSRAAHSLGIRGGERSLPARRLRARARAGTLQVSEQREDTGPRPEPAGSGRCLPRLLGWEP